MLRLDHRELEPHERKIVAMRAGGASVNEIAYWLETSGEAVRQVLARPRCANALLKFTSMLGSEMMPAIEELGENMRRHAARAFEVEVENMERLHTFASTEETKYAIRAAAAASTTAQDILDRTGNRAPTRTVNANLHAIAPQTIDHLASVIREMKGGDHDQNGDGENA